MPIFLQDKVPSIGHLVEFSDSIEQELQLETLTMSCVCPLFVLSSCKLGLVQALLGTSELDWHLKS